MRRQLLGVSHSLCRSCGELIPARITAVGDEVVQRLFCPRHGESEALIWRGVDSYLASRRFVKPAWRPAAFAGDSSRPCPHGCGLCERHEQHLCLPIIEITERCDLHCPICLVSAGSQHQLSRPDFSRILDGLIRAEHQIDVLNLSGGEPLLHPQLLELIDDALARPEIVRVSISTNGLRLLADRQLVAALGQRDVVISLQLDGFNEAIYQTLRGADLLQRKLQLLELLQAADLTTSLTMTVAGGINQDQLGAMLDLLFSREHIVSLMLQPLALSGRAADLPPPTRERLSRLTIPDLIDLLGSAGHPAVAAEDFVPLPCSHPLCFSLAFYLMVDDPEVAGGGAVAVSRLADVETMLDLLANRGLAGLDADQHEQIRDLIYQLWSGPAASIPEAPAVLATLRQLLRELSAPSSGTCSCFDPRRTFTVAERRLKSIFIHAFQDAETFDLARVRRCCNAYPQADGRLMPVCVHNLRGRGDGGDGGI